MPVRDTSSVRNSLRAMAKEAKESGLAGPPPDPEPDELIEAPLAKAYSMEFMFRMSGLTILVYLTYLAVEFWKAMRDGGGIGMAVFYAVVAAFFVYLWRMGRLFQKMMRVWNMRDIQAADRRSLAARKRELDEFERSLKQQNDLLEEQAEVLEQAELALAKKAATVDGRELAKQKQRQARQVADLAEMAKELESDS